MPAPATATATTTTIDLRKYLFVLQRRWVLCTLVFLLVLAAGIAYCLFWPRTYQATALVVVQPQKVPGTIVKTTVTTRLQERLQIITQQVLSRTRLMEIIDRFNLYPEMRKTAVPDALAERMRKDISIKITRQNYFTVSFLYRDPKAAAAVANALAAFYVDSNLRLREDDAVGTARFLSRELERMRTQLKEWENRITAFKEKHLEELPGSEDRLMNTLSRLQNQLENIDYKIEVERNRQNGLEFEIAKLTFQIEDMAMKKAHLLKSGVAGGAMGEDLAGSDPETIRQRIENLRLRYTDKHPDIIRLKAQLKRAEAKRKALIAKLKAEGKLKEGEKPTEAAALDLQLGSLKQSREKYAQLVAESKERVKKLLEERAKVVQAMAKTRQHLENLPAVAEKLQELSRGYDVLKRAYEKMHAKWLEANMAANLERTQRGEQFEVVDPAEVPQSPYRPNVRKALPLSVAAALALAVGVAFGLNYIDTSFTSVEQAERLSELPVLVVVPPLETQHEKERRRLRTTVIIAIYSLSFLFLMGLTGILLTGRAARLKELWEKMFA
jgi:polysaccharide chain length determinant protein (PEP-CTERM system associated)